ncbi:MAG: glycosyltransferase [Geminicoccaceae bacterium]
MSVKKKSLLYLAHRAPFPPDKGDRIRGYRHLTRLARLGDVDLVAMADSAAEADIAREGLAPLCRHVEVIPRRMFSALFQVGMHLLTGKSLSTAWFDDVRVRAALVRLKARDRYDLAFAFSSGIGPWLARIEADREVVDLCDLDALKWKALAGDGGPMAPVYALEAERLFPIEQQLGERADLSFLSTPNEAEDLIAASAPHNLNVLTNGVHWGDFLHLAPPSEAPPAVAFLGQMDYPPNVLAAAHLAQEVMPEVRKTVPGTVLKIIGRAPTQAVQRLEDEGKVEVTGAVESVPAALFDVRVFCAPLDRGRGIPNKILDALAAGRATVISSWSAKALSGKPGEDYLVADGAQARAEAIAALLNDPMRADALGAAGQAYVRRHHDWDRVLDQLEAALVDLLADKSKVRPLVDRPSSPRPFSGLMAKEAG